MVESVKPITLGVDAVIARCRPGDVEPANRDGTPAHAEPWPFTQGARPGAGS